MMLWSCYEKNLGKISPEMITIREQKSSRQSAENPVFKPFLRFKIIKKPTDEVSLGDLETTALPTELYP